MDNTNKIISIVTATYNAASCLENLIKSFILQKTQEIEFIIIDGESVDDTLNIINKYSEYIDYWISEPDNGIYDAWNKGINVARGRWIMFLGADDILNSDSLKKYLYFLDNNDTLYIDYISSHNAYVNSDGEVLKILGSSYSSWRSMRRGMSVAHVGSLHNRKLFEQVGLYNTKYSICADYELLLRKRNRLKTLFLDTVIVQMRSGGMSLSHEAIRETYVIRKNMCTLPLVVNDFYFIKDLLLFYLFRLRKNV